jgi:urease gamma subunit
MHLLPREQVGRSVLTETNGMLLTNASVIGQDKLLLANLGFLAQKRLARGLKLNRSEAIALIAFQLQEYVRDGRHNVADLMQLGKEFLGRRHVLEGVEEAIHDVQIEGSFHVSIPVIFAAHSCSYTLL